MPSPKTPKSRKAPPTTAIKIGKKGRRRSSTVSVSTFDFSSSLSSADDNYSAVDDISDDEDDDEEDVTAVEERAMVGETTSSPGATRSLFDDDGSDNDGDDDDSDDEDEEEAEEEDEDDEGGAGLIPSSDESWEGLSPTQHEEIQQEEEEPKWPIRKKSVHWASEEEDSSDDNDGANEDFFPDIFVLQSELDRNFRRRIEDEENSGSDYTDLDYHEYEEVMFQKIADRHATPRTPQQELQPAFEPTTCETIPESEEFIEGYNYNDDGSTTEEEDFEVRPRAGAAALRDHSDDDTSDDEQPARRSKGEPLSSRFNLQKYRKKPIALYNHETKRMMIFTPDRHHELGQIPHNPFLQPMLPESPLELNMDFTQYPLDLGNNATANGDLQLFGQLFPMPVSEQESETNAMDGQASSDLDLDGQEGDGFAFESYINLSEDSSDEEGDGQDATTPSRPVTAHSDANLSHINSRNVGAFRQHQANAQLMGTGATHDSIAFSGPLNSTTIRGIKSDRFDTAAAPLTPARRHKRQSSDMMRSPLDAVSQKRKASGETESFNSHKKQKSISSDVAGLQL